MKKILIFLISILLLNSCQKDVEPSLTKGKLKKITELIDDKNNTTTEFTYDLTGRLSQINTSLIVNGTVSTSKKEQFLRDSQGNIIKIKVSQSDSKQQTDTEKLIEYNDTDKITKITEYNTTTNIKIIEQYTYALDELGVNRPTYYDKLEVRNIRDSLFAFVPIESTQYTWLNGNVVSQKTRNMQTTTSKEYSYTYDEAIQNPLNVLYENEIKLPNIPAFSKNQLATTAELPENNSYKNDNYAILSRPQNQTQFKQSFGKWSKLKEILYDYW